MPKSGKTENRFSHYSEIFIFLTGLIFAFLILRPMGADASTINKPPNSLGLISGLVGHWSFDGKDTAGVKAYDLSGNANTGTLTNGPVRAIGKIGQALSFDGSNDYVNAGTGLDQNGAVSISAWFKTNTVATGMSSIVSSCNDGSNCDYHLGINRTAGRLELLRSANAVSVTGNTNLSAGVWYHVVGVLSGSSNNWTATIYLNGVNDGSASDANNPNGTNGPLQIGALNAGFLFNGLIDDVRIYNRALNAEEIQRLYNMGR